MRFAGKDLTSLFGKLRRTGTLEPDPSDAGSIPYVSPSQSEMPYIESLAETGSGRGRTYSDYLDTKRKELEGFEEHSDPWKKPEKKEEEVVKPVDPDPVDPVDEKTDGRKFTENLYGGQSLTDDELAAKMKYNPATTPEDWARAFGKCRTTTSSDKHASIPSDCYWPEEGGLEGSDFYSVGKGGGTAHAKRGQAASRAKAAAARAKNKSKSNKTNKRGHNSSGSGMSNRSRGK